VFDHIQADDSIKGPDPLAREIRADEIDVGLFHRLRACPIACSSKSTAVTR